MAVRPVYEWIWGVEAELMNPRVAERDKRTLVARVKQNMLKRLRPHFDGDDDAIMELESVRDSAGPLQLAYWQVANCCVVIEHAPRWDELCARRLANALLLCAVPDAEERRKFKGRRPGEGRGPIRKAIVRVWRGPFEGRTEVEPIDMWSFFAERPELVPRGWKFCETTKLGKYIEGPKAKDGISYKRFQNLVREVVKQGR
jgi:hypothetical protein